MPDGHVIVCIRLISIPTNICNRNLYQIFAVHRHQQTGRLRRIHPHHVLIKRRRARCVLFFMETHRVDSLRPASRRRMVVAINLMALYTAAILEKADESVIPAVRFSVRGAHVLALCLSDRPCAWYFPSYSYISTVDCCTFRFLCICQAVSTRPLQSSTC